MHEFGIVFDGAAQATPQGRTQAPQAYNYLVGGPEHRRENVPAFESVWYEGLYPGIDLELQGRRSGLKYNFHLAPGADPSAIRIHYDGVAGIALAKNGSLEIDIAEGWDSLSDSAPYIYQLVDGHEVPVAGRYEVLDRHTYGFAITGAYDPGLPLVIDPAVAWGTYLGGGGGEWGGDFGNGIAVDNDGNVLITGQTDSSGWTSGGWDTTYNGSKSLYSKWTEGEWVPPPEPTYDAFVVKLTSDGAHVWSSYLGSQQADSGKDIAVDGEGNVLVTGWTESGGWVSGGWDTHVDASDSFVVKLTPAGEHVWSSYIGGENREGGMARSWGIAVDGDGNVLVTGQTDTWGWVSGGYDTRYSGGGWFDPFVVKLTAEGAHVWSTYLGGRRHDVGDDIAVDAYGNVLVTGKTRSLHWISGGWDTTYAGTWVSGEDGFAVKLTSAGAHVWSTYLGGSEEDRGHGIAVDSRGNVLITGETKSPGWVSSGWDTTHSDGGEGEGHKDGFVVKLTADGAHAWSSYLGSNELDQGQDIAVDGVGNILVTGTTESSGWVSGGWDTTFDGGSDAFVVKLTPEGTHAWSSYVGSSGREEGYGIATDGGGKLLVTGKTGSAGWLSGGWDTTRDGARDGFVVKIVDSGGEGENASVFSVVPRGGWFEDGDTCELSVALSNPTGDVLYGWQKDGALLPGEEGSTLSLTPVSFGDEGWYVARAADESKNVFATEPVYIRVVEEGSLPAAGPMSLGLLGCAMALAALLCVRRRN